MFKKSKRLLPVVIAVALFIASPAKGNEVCGDLNHDEVVDIGDLVLFVQTMWGIDPPPINLEEADLNFNGTTDIVDLVFMVDYQFRDGSAPICEISFESYGPACGMANISGWENQTGKFFEYNGRGINVWELNYELDCCYEFVPFHYADSNVLNIIYADTFYIYQPYTCDCFCSWDFLTVIPNLKNGQYIVYGDTVEITENMPRLINPEITKIEPTGEESITIDYLDGKMYFNHHNSLHYCYYSVQLLLGIQDNVIRLYETEKNIENSVDYNMCNYDISGIIYDLPPGEYKVEVYGQANPTGTLSPIYEQWHTF